MSDTWKGDITLNVENKETIILNYNLAPVSILIHEWKILLTRKTKWCYVDINLLLKDMHLLKVSLFFFVCDAF